MTISTAAALPRRTILTSAPAAALLLLAGCAEGTGFSLTEAIRRLLTVSSQRAFAQLLRPGGFYDSEVARLGLPPQLGGAGGGGVVGAVLGSGLLRDRLTRLVNDAAAKGAERAAPLVADAIRGLTVADALALVRGGPQAATGYLEARMGGALIDAMLPGVGEALRVADNPIVGEALRAASGIDLAGLVRDVGVRANRGIWSAIGAEEAAIRANPQATGDPLLIGLLTLAR